MNNPVYHTTDVHGPLRLARSAMPSRLICRLGGVPRLRSAKLQCEMDQQVNEIST